MSDADLPRRPAAPLRVEQPEQLPLDLSGAASKVDAVAGRRVSGDWVEYVEPELVSLRVARRVLIASRSLVIVWAVAAVVVALLIRSDALDGFEDGQSVKRIAWLGTLCAIGVVGAGWYWADRVAINIHRLQARLPSRLRCATAFAAPVVWSGLLATTVLDLDRPELVDLRPLIVAVLFAIAAWRPYALLRRMIRSLIRVDSDLLVAAAYVLDLGSFGMLWWRLQTFPDSVGTSGVASGLIGLAAIAALASLPNVIVWNRLLVDVDRGIAHRQLALRTRHDHRQIRLMGIDPTQPEVRLALMRIAQEDDQQRQAEEARAGEVAPARKQPNAAIRAVDRAHRRSESGAVRRPPQLPDIPRAAAGRPLRELFGSIERVDEPAVGPEQTGEPELTRAAEQTGVAEDTEQTEQTEQTGAVGETEEAKRADEADEADEAEQTAAPAAEGEAAEAKQAEETDETEQTAAEQTGVADEMERTAVKQADEPEQTEQAEQTGQTEQTEQTAAKQADAPDETEQTDQTEQTEQTASEPDTFDLVARRAHAPFETTPDLVVADLSESDQRNPPVLDRLASRAQTFGSDDEIGPDDLRRRLAGRLDAPTDARSIQERLAQAGISASMAGAFASVDDFDPDDLDPDEHRGGDPELTVAHVYSLEVVRYLLLAAIVVAGAASAWFLMRAVGVDELVDGDIAPDSVERLDLARRSAVAALGGALAIVPLWCTFAARWTRRVGIELVGMGRCFVLFVLAASINVLMLIFDAERSTLSLIGTLACLGAALWSIPVMISIQRTFVRSTTVSSYLPVTLAFVTATSWIAGFQSPVVPGDSVEMLSFFGGLQLVVLAVSLIVAAVSTADVVEAIQLSPAIVSAERDRSEGEREGVADHGGRRDRQ